MTTKRNSAHAAAVATWNQRRAQHPAERAKLAETLEAKQKKYDEWRKPHLEFLAAQNALNAFDYSSSQEDLRLEDSARAAADPLIAATIRSLTAEDQATRLKFAVWGEPDTEVGAYRASNLDVINARTSAIREAIRKLKSLQLADVPDVRAEVRAIVGSIPSLEELDAR